MAIAAFDYAAWAARYPYLADNVNPNAAFAYFSEATLYLDNTDSSIVVDAGQRLALLNMVVAHIALLNGAGEANGQPNGLVGRVSQATEGSVSVSVDLGAVPGSAAWYAQTGPGLSFWQATARYRTAMYRPGAQPYFGPFAGAGRVRRNG